MKILFVTLGNEELASSRTRVFQYLPYLSEQGIEFKIIRYNLSLDLWIFSNIGRNNFFNKVLFRGLMAIVYRLNVLYKTYNNFRILNSSPKVDVVFIQKAILPISVQKKLANLNPNIIFDFDDALYAAPKIYNVEGFLNILQLSKLVVIENKYNERYVHNYNKNTLIITGPIDCKKYDMKRAQVNELFTIGWIGSPSTTYYLDIIKGPLLRFKEKYGNVFQLNLVGASEVDFGDIIVNKFKWSLETENDLLSQFDVGVAPLYDDEWSRGKGGYKILQYMAKGIPPIVSPVGINSDIVVHGINGFHAITEEDWFASFEKLFLDKKLYDNIALNARKTVQDNYSVEHYAPALLSGIMAVLPRGKIEG